MWQLLVPVGELLNPDPKVSVCVWRGSFETFPMLAENSSAFLMRPVVLILPDAPHASCVDRNVGLFPRTH